MKNLFKLTIAVLAIAVTATACDPAKKPNTEVVKIDSTVKVDSTIKKDTTVVVDSAKIDSTKK